MNIAVIAKVREIVEPVLVEMGYELVDLQLRTEQVGLVLRLIIYKEAGISIDDCTRVSREVGHLLEIEDPIERAYHLEVSSPGLDRPLKTERDFARNIGKKVRILYLLQEESKEVEGVIAASGDSAVELTAGEEIHQILLENIIKAKLVIEF